MADDNSRTCSKCGHSYPLTTEYFYRRADDARGFQRYCKLCHQNVSHIHYQTHTDEWLERSGKWSKAHPRSADRRAREALYVALGALVKVFPDHESPAYQQAQIALQEWCPDD